MERELRKYERIAYLQHFCDRCCNQILPGNMYEGRVVITDKKRLFVWKNHIYPRCDYPKEPEENAHLENIVNQREELKLAA